MLFSAIPADRAADAVTRQIETLVVSGVLRPGDRLPGERDLAEEMGVSRPILRDALKRLEEDGLVVTRPGGGTEVADVVGTVFSEPMTRLIRRHGQATDGYFEFRREMEGFASALAAERATPADLEAIRALLTAMEVAHEAADAGEEARLDVEFHTAISEAAHNLVLLHTLRACYRLLLDNVFYDRARLFAVGDAREALLSQHRAIVAAIVGRDPAAAREAAVAHIDYVAATVGAVEAEAGREMLSRLRSESRAARTRPGRRRAEPAASAAPSRSPSPIPSSATSRSGE